MLVLLSLSLSFLCLVPRASRRLTSVYLGSTTNKTDGASINVIVPEEYLAPAEEGGEGAVAAMNGAEAAADGQEREAPQGQAAGAAAVEAS
jgi:hypothetical protein